jgi:hypothetical protein
LHQLTDQAEDHLNTDNKMAVLPEILLIDETFIKKYTAINDSVDTAIIRPCIYLAQDKYLVNYLGTDLTNKLKADAQAGTLAGDYETLIDQYVRKMLVWWTMIELYPLLVYKHDNGNIVSRDSENATSISESELHKLMDAAKDNARYYTQRMLDYIRQNVSLFPEYSSNTSPDQSPYTQLYTQTGLMYSQGLKQSTLRWSIKDFLPVK